MGREPFVVAGPVLMPAATVPMGWVTTNWQLIHLRLRQGMALAAIAAPVCALASNPSRSGGEGRQTSIVAMDFGLVPRDRGQDRQVEGGP